MRAAALTMFLMPTLAYGAPGDTLAKEGEVTRIEAEKVVVNLGSKDGLENRSRVEIFRREDGLLEGSKTEVTIAVGSVIAVNEGSAIVELGLNEVVDVGDRARLSDKPRTADFLSPPRFATTSLQGLIRPFLGVDPAGAGVMGELSLVVRASIPLSFRAELMPAAFALGSENGRADILGHALVGFDDRWFELAVGGGFLFDEESSGSGPAPDTQSFGVVSQYFRLGSMDGVNTQVRLSLFSDSSRFRLAYLEGALFIPIDSRITLMSRLAGSERRFGFGEFGIRFRTHGNGGPGTLFITPTAGGAGVDEYYGPSAGISIETRL